MSQTDYNISFRDFSDYFTTAPDWDLFVYNLTNISNLDDLALEERDLWREIPLGIVLTFLCLLTTVGNAMVLHAVRTERRLQSVSMGFDWSKIRKMSYMNRLL